MADIQAYQLERQLMRGAWGRYVSERLQKSIRKYDVNDSGSLSYSIIYSLVSANGDDISIRHQFNFYGKFVDMRVGKGYPIGTAKADSDIHKYFGGGRKAKPWFSKTYYGQVAELRNLEMRKWGNQFIGVIKEEITKTVL